MSHYISACRHPDNLDNVHLEMQRNENGPGQVKNAPLFDSFGGTNDES